MRSLLFFGAITAFFATSFVMPSDQSLASLSQDARSELEKTAESALMKNIPNQKELNQVAKVMSVVAKDPVILERLKSAKIGVSTANQQQLLESTVSTLKNVAKQSLPTSKKIVVSYLHPKKHPSQEWLERVKNEADPTRKALLAHIDLAEKEKNIRLCNESSLLQKKDFFTLCLARVTQNSARCDQLSSHMQNDKTLCLAEFSS